MAIMLSVMIHTGSAGLEGFEIQHSEQAFLRGYLLCPACPIKINTVDEIFGKI